jgi:metal-responsive CopG/Arc/MetJ family transcriptional regulator
MQDRPVGHLRTERVSVTLSSDEVAAIDEFRLLAGIPSRPAAVRELLKCGLAAENRRPSNNKGS